MKNLDKYKKVESESEPMATTSVHIKKSQKDFIEHENLNLSEITRDAIDEVRRQSITPSEEKLNEKSNKTKTS